MRPTTEMPYLEIIPFRYKCCDPTLRHTQYDKLFNIIYQREILISV